MKPFDINVTKQCYSNLKQKDASKKDSNCCFPIPLVYLYSLSNFFVNLTNVKYPNVNNFL